MTARTAASVLALLPVAVCFTLAAQGQPQQPPVFRGGINLVQTDVTVLGPDGRVRHGLTIDDFELFEDGERIPILGFAEVNLPDADDAPPWMRDSGTDVRTALQGRVLLFLLDDGQVPYHMEPGAGFIHPKVRIEAVRRIAEQFINRMGPDDAAAVVCVYAPRCDQDFTSDRTLLRRAIDKFTPFDSPPESYKASAGMADSVSKYLQGQGSRRRTIIYVTPHQPIRPLVWPPVGLGGSTADKYVLAAFESAMRAGVTVYSVNPNSLVPLASEPSDDPDAPESTRDVRFSAPPRSLALETGGFNISRPDQFAEGVDQILRETGSYYLLGYEPPPKKDTGYNMLKGLRELEVRVKAPGLTIKTHRGYITMPPVKANRNPPAESTAALAGVLPKTDLPLRIAAAPFAVPGRPEALVAVTLGVTEPAVDARTLDRLDVEVRAFTPHGDQRAMVRTHVDTHLVRTRDAEARVDVVVELQLKPGTYELRAGSTSTRLGLSGSVYTDVVVPDFAAAPLSISGVLLMSVPRPDALIPQPLSPIFPVTPTTHREFTSKSLVRAYLRVYQGAKAPLTPILLTATIADATNAVVWTQPQTLAVDRFSSTRSTDVRIDVPIAALRPGWHRLRIIAGGTGDPVFRDVMFQIK